MAPANQPMEVIVVDDDTSGDEVMEVTPPADPKRKLGDAFRTEDAETKRPRVIIPHASRDGQQVKKAPARVVLPPTLGVEQPARKASAPHTATTSRNDRGQEGRAAPTREAAPVPRSLLALKKSSKSFSSSSSSSSSSSRNLQRLWPRLDVFYLAVLNHWDAVVEDGQIVGLRDDRLEALEAKVTAVPAGSAATAGFGGSDPAGQVKNFNKVFVPTFLVETFCGAKDDLRTNRHASTPDHHRCMSWSCRVKQLV